MRVNVYAEEITQKIELVQKTTEAGSFIGIRFFLELPVTIPMEDGRGMMKYQGPFIHKPADDSSAVTFWGKRDFRDVLQKALDTLNTHYGQEPNIIRVTHAEYTDLTRSAEVLSALQAAGVDNWEGYEGAMENLK